MSEIRQHNLQEIADKFASQRGLADALDTTPGYINQLLTGHRGIGEKAARKIEKKLKLNYLALDNLSNIDNTTNKVEKYSTYEKQALQNAIVLEQKNIYLLSNKNEISLLDAFRRLTGEQQQTVITNAQEIAQKNLQIIKELNEKMVTL